MSKHLLLIGSDGALGKKITDEFDNSSNNEYEITKIDLHNTNQLAQLTSNKEYALALITTPPLMHLEYTKKLLKNPKISKIISEKPFPIEKNSIFKAKKETNKIFILDHYLFKAELPNIINHFNQEKNNIAEIHLSILEDTKEMREWMKHKESYGGVVYDLAHHLIAILYKLFNETLFSDINDFKILNTSYFTDETTSADKEVSFSFHIQNLKIICHVGKEVDKTKKKISFIHKDKTIKEFLLNDRVNYQTILTQESSQSQLLPLNISLEINTFLKRILELLEDQTYKRKIQAIPDPTALQLITSFSDEFKHRHSFYWASYYKFLTSYVLVLVSPLLIYYYILELKKETDILAFNGVSIIIIGLSIILNYYILVKLLPKTKRYLDDEDLRLKIPIERMREIYYLKFNMNTYPNQNLPSSGFFGKSIKKGLGSNYMFEHLEFVCKTIAILVTGLLIIISYLNSSIAIPTDIGRVLSL